MKKMIFVIVGIVSLLILSETTYAQKGEYFVGKWEVKTFGTPNGDGVSILTLERDADGNLGGILKPGEGAEVKLTRVELDGDEITVYFTSASGYDVYLYLEKIDDNNVEGSMMDFFDAKGKRIVEEKKE